MVRRRLAGATCGALLAVGLTGCFSAPPQIVLLEPNHGSTSVPADAPIRVVFDKPVIPSSIVGHFSVSPTIPGCDLTAAFAPGSPRCWITWLPGNTGFELFHEDAVFAPLTHYLFTLSGGFTDAAGDRNGLDHHWDVTSAPAPRLRGVTPSTGTTGVPVDTPLTVSFDSSMDATGTANAIQLSPSVPGTRVLQDVADHTRFTVLPGQLLKPNTTYTITVGPDARGEDEQSLASDSPSSAQFSTGSGMGLSHAAVLAAVPGEAATVVSLPALTGANPGQPAAAPVVLSATRCEIAPSCDGVAEGAPTQTYSAVAVSADSRFVAVVAAGQPAAGQAPTDELEVVDVVHGDIQARFTGGTGPAWAPSGEQLAFTVGGRGFVYDAARGIETPLTGLTGLVRAPVWAGASSLVVDAGSVPARLSVINLALDAQYAVPGAPAGAVAIAASPDGAAVAVMAAGDVVSVLPLSGTAAPVQLAAPMSPVGFEDRGTVVGVSYSGTVPTLLRVSLVGGDSSSVALPVTADLATVRLDASGRRVAFLADDATGLLEAYAANVDGSAPVALTPFAFDELEAVSVATAA